MNQTSNVLKIARNSHKYDTTASDQNIIPSYSPTSKTNIKNQQEDNR